MADNDDLRARLKVYVAEEGINVPVTFYEAHGNKGGLKIRLYGAGDRLIVWNPKPEAKAKPRSRAKKKEKTT